MPETAVVQRDRPGRRAGETRNDAATMWYRIRRELCAQRHRGEHPSRRQRVYPDGGVHMLHRLRIGEAEQAGFGGCIGLPDESCGRDDVDHIAVARDQRSEEHTSELQSLMRISYAVFCLKK